MLSAVFTAAVACDTRQDDNESYDRKYYGYRFHFSLPDQSKIDHLKRAYEAIFLAEFRRQIDRTERIARVIALSDSQLAAGLSFEESDAIANEAVASVMEIEDEVYFSASGKWQ